MIARFNGLYLTNSIKLVWFIPPINVKGNLNFFKTKTALSKLIFCFFFDKAVFVLRKLRLPFTLIGGINHTNFMELVKYKPLNLAMIKSIWDYEKGPVKSALVFKKILNEEC